MKKGEANKPKVLASESQLRSRKQHLKTLMNEGSEITRFDQLDKWASTRTFTSEDSFLVRDATIRTTTLPVSPEEAQHLNTARSSWTVLIINTQATAEVDYQSGISSLLGPRFATFSPLSRDKKKMVYSAEVEHLQSPL